MIRIVAYGVPAPKGSTRSFVPKGWTRAITTGTNPKTKPWQEAVKQAALVARGDALPLEEPVALYVRFYLPRPKSTPKRITEQAKKPDLDKLLRSTKDALKDAGIYRDDALVIVVVASKHFAAGQDDKQGEHGIPRAEIEVGPARSSVLLASWKAAHSFAQRSA